MNAPPADQPSAPSALSKPRKGWRAVLNLFGSESAPQSFSKTPSVPLTPGLPPLELANLIRRRFYEDRQWARERRAVWSARSTFLHALTFVLAVAAIVFLGVASLDGFAIVGFICTTVGTTVAGLETFFNWRSRWVAADSALARWHELEESLSLYVASNEAKLLSIDHLVEFDTQRRSVWSELSQTWLDERRGSKGYES
jgi:hypothetical protein